MVKANKKKPVVKVKKLSLGGEMDAVDAAVKRQGERDTGSPALSLCPRCGSSDLSVRRIDIPGFAPEVQVCSRCGFRSESAVQVVSPIEYVEDVDEEESEGGSRIEEIQKRLQARLQAAALKPHGAKQGKLAKLKTPKPGQRTKQHKVKPKAIMKKKR